MSSNCGYLSGLFSLGKESKLKEISVDNISYDVFCIGMRILYLFTPEEELSETVKQIDLLEGLAFANYYDIPVLQSIIEHIFTREVQYKSIENALNCLRVFAQTENSVLFRHALDYFSTQFVEVESILGLIKDDHPKLVEIVSQAFETKIQCGIVLRRREMADLSILPKQLRIGWSKKLLDIDKIDYGFGKQHKFEVVLPDGNQKILVFLEDVVSVVNSCFINLYSVCKSRTPENDKWNAERYYKDKFKKTFQTDGILYLFNPANRHSFLILNRYRKLLTDLCKSYDPCVIIANDVDKAIFLKRVVSYNEGRSLALSWKCPYVETSLSRGWNDVDPLHMLLNEIAIRKHLELKTVEKSK
eukprot:TRINITY_DN2726_c0_g1_i3.p1 TRINITY_DN2726_c0_g1~~TRINITY_DN2726_c0_g1_i3.p1  ORF type:complete len:407 (+),score=52.00 TRINITY_DN2726_c0_g1_i3:145-1221(+)